MIIIVILIVIIIKIIITIIIIIIIILIFIMIIINNTNNIIIIIISIIIIIISIIIIIIIISIIIIIIIIKIIWISNIKNAAKISHLLYMDDLKLYGKSAPELESLLNTVRIFSNDNSMEFGLDKCATLTIKRGSVIQPEGINLPNNNIRGLNLEESYKYLEILQADDIKHVQVKKKAASEYTKRVRKVLKSKLNGGNTIRAINSWAVPVIRYTAGIVDWT